MSTKPRSRSVSSVFLTQIVVLSIVCYSSVASLNDFPLMRDIEIHEDSPRDYEIVNLKNTIETLQERERTLEIKLLEFYGLKEQETVILELQNQVKINNMEAKIFSLKIETLTADKMRLEDRVANYENVASELEVAKVKIKQLKKKLRLEANQSKEQILTLEEKVMKLQDDEKLRKLEADELKRCNDSLQIENSELAQRLEDEETEALKAESQQLRMKNEELVKEVGQLQADLVYLRWINACLRFELRNYQPDSGKVIARDLSKTLSPKSEDKAKKLILEYANKESDFDSDWSSSVDNSSPRKTPRKNKVFSKLMRLVRGKDRGHLSRSSSMDNVGSRHSSYSPSRSSGLSSSSSSGRLDYMISNTDSLQQGKKKDEPENAQKTELVKYAEVCRRSASACSF